MTNLAALCCCGGTCACAHPICVDDYPPAIYPSIGRPIFVTNPQHYAGVLWPADVTKEQAIRRTRRFKWPEGVTAAQVFERITRPNYLPPRKPPKVREPKVNIPRFDDAPKKPERLPGGPVPVARRPEPQPVKPATSAPTPARKPSPAGVRRPTSTPKPKSPGGPVPATRGSNVLRDLLSPTAIGRLLSRPNARTATGTRSPWGGARDPLTPISTQGVPYALPGGARPPARGTPSARDNCQPRKRKPGKPRTVCYRGTYQELASGLIKRRKEKIPCRQSRKRQQSQPR